jgi:hypothetical protein
VDDETRRRKIGQLVGERAALQAQIDALNERIRGLVEESGRRMEKEFGLPARRSVGTVNGVLTPPASAAALNRSAGNVKDPHSALARLQKAADAHRMSIRGLCAELRAKGHKVTPPAVSMALAGERRISEEVAGAVEKLIGYRATKANWPGGIRATKA